MGKIIVFLPVLPTLSLTRVRMKSSWRPNSSHQGNMLNISPQRKKTKTKMPSLVKKWQSIQRELDEEENSSSSDEDRDVISQKRIEEWKQQQLIRYERDSKIRFDSTPLLASPSVICFR